MQPLGEQPPDSAFARARRTVNGDCSRQLLLIHHIALSIRLPLGHAISFRLSRFPLPFSPSHILGTRHRILHERLAMPNYGSSSALFEPASALLPFAGHEPR